MAKDKKKVSTVNPMIAVLQNIKASGRVSQADGEPLLAANPQLIEVNVGDLDGNGLAAARLTAAGEAMIGGATAPVAPTAPVAGSPAPAFIAITGFVAPESKRGFAKGERKSKYDFDSMAVGASFFVAKSAGMENPLKTLGSTVSNATNKYRVETTEVREVTRAVRGDDKKAKLDAVGNKIMETVKLPVYNYPRKFIIRGVEAGKVYGQWTAPADGVVIVRSV